MMICGVHITGSRVDDEEYIKTFTEKSRIYAYLPTVAGVYALFFKDNPGKKYYGSTMNLRTRVYRNLSSLINKIHHNPGLQYDFNNHSITDLSVEIIRLYHSDEDGWIDQELELIRNDPGCYNIIGSKEYEDGLKGKYRRPSVNPRQKKPRIRRRDDFTI